MAPAPPGALDRRTLRRVVVVLSVTEITSWGVLYYALPVLAPAIARDTGWTLTAITGAFSLSLLTAAVCGMGVGRWIDRRGPRPVMTAGALLAVPGLVAVAHAPTYPLFVAAWVLTGAATSALLYPPAFAALTHWGGVDRVRALTAITLVAGLASTVFAPLTAGLEAALEWQRAYLVLAVVLAVVAVPGHWLGLKAPWVPHEHPHHPPGTPRPPATWRTRPFLVLLLAMSATALCVYAVVINLVPLLLERGLTTVEAALALGLGGVGQVSGRLGYSWFSGRTTPAARAAIVCTVVAVTTGVMALLPGPAALLFAVSMLVGVGRGVFTLIQATAVSDRWGTFRFGRLNGIMSAPVMAATAAAPWIGSALAELLGSHARAFLVLAVLAAGAALLMPWTLPRTSPGRPLGQTR